MVDVNEILTETKAEDVKYALINTKYKFYVRYGEDLVSYPVRNVSIAVERFTILSRPLQIIISIQLINP